MIDKPQPQLEQRNVEYDEVHRYLTAAHGSWHDASMAMVRRIFELEAQVDLQNGHIRALSELARLGQEFDGHQAQEEDQ